MMKDQSVDEVVLPFTFSAKVSATIPNFIDRAVNKSYYDAPFIPILIGNEYWVFQTECNIAPNYTPDTHVFYRWKGTCVDDCVQQPSGVMDASFPREGGERHWVMGLWYDAGAATLYAALHAEFNYTGTDNVNGFNWCPRCIRLASSTDKGLSWHYEGDILTSEYPMGLLDFYAMSGSNKNNGCGDFDFYVDTAGGYFYLWWFSGSCDKGDFKSKPFSFGRYAARCAIRDKMAPGKWTKFYKGSWSEPGLGGRASIVLPNAAVSDVCYNTYLKAYMAIVPGGNGVDQMSLFYQYYVATCSDLATQDWTPCGYLAGLDSKPYFALMIDADGIDPYTCGRTFRLYKCYGDWASQRLDITLGPGQTATTGMTRDFNYEPVPESGDPMENRQTKIVGCASPEMTYSGTGWSERAAPHYYEGKSKASSAPNDRVEFSFKGGAIYWRAVHSPAGGKADVYVDGVRERAVDLYRPTLMPYQFAFIKTGLAPKASHTIRIVVKGERNAKSGGAAVEHMAFEYSAESYRASAGFSSVRGKNNWDYQQWNGVAYSDLRFDAPDEKRFYNEWVGEGNTRVSNRWQIPDVNEAVRKWTAPHDGRVRIEGAAALEAENPQGISVRILKNGSEVWPAQSLAGKTPASHDVTIPVSRNDAIFFIAKRLGANPSARVFWDPVITYAD